MIRLRTASGNVGWMDVNDRDVAAMVASGRWVLASSLDYSRTKHGEMIRQAEPIEAAAAEEPETVVRRGPGRPKKAA